MSNSLRANIFQNLILCLSISFTLSANAIDFSELGDAKISTDEIMSQALACDDCFDYKIIGMCFWLKCTLTGCSVEESIKVSHYIPDLVVSAYTNKSAWDITADWNEAPVGTTSTEQSNDKLESYLDFKSVDIITHPTLLIYNTLGEEDLFCKSQQQIPMLPLFLSSLDPFWIQSSVEGMLAGTIGSFSMNNIIAATGAFPNIPGMPAPEWAHVYPRCGWGTHPYDPINAAVAAHRASEIVTRNLQPHVYLPASGNCDNRCWKPDSVKANNDENKFQMNYPVSEKSAKPFGGAATWANGKQKNHETYTWSLWRKYQCCDKKGQAFLFDVEWEQ